MTIKAFISIIARAERIADAMRNFALRVSVIRARHHSAYGSVCRIRTAVRLAVTDERLRDELLREIQIAEDDMCRLADAISALVQMELAATDYGVLMAQLRGELDDLQKLTVVIPSFNDDKLEEKTA